MREFWHPENILDQLKCHYEIQLFTSPIAERRYCDLSQAKLRLLATIRPIRQQTFALTHSDLDKCPRRLQSAFHLETDHGAEFLHLFPGDHVT